MLSFCHALCVYSYDCFPPNGTVSPCVSSKLSKSCLALFCVSYTPRFGSWLHLIGTGSQEAPSICWSCNGSCSSTSLLFSELLTFGNSAVVHIKPTSVLATSPGKQQRVVEMRTLARLLILFFISCISAAWFLMWMFRPTKHWTKFWTPLVARVGVSKAYATLGAYFIVYVVPVLLVSIVAALLQHRGQTERLCIKKERLLKSFRQSPWSFPVLIRGPISVLSAAECIFIVIFVGYVVYYFGISTSTSFSNINHKMYHGKDLLHRKMEIVGTRLGLAGIFALLMLFFPVTRGSSILQLINLPFEQAVNFHIWIATTMMVVFTAHGVVYIIFWILEGEIHELWAWHAREISGLSGLFALIFGLAIWVTSLGPVRRKRFQLFYYTHHLYILFLLFYALHVGDALYSMVLGAVLLFFISRLMRYLQSRETVDIIAARMLTSDSMELIVAKQPDLHYNAASFVFLNVPAVSALQWHPFTVTSSSNVDKDHLSLYIKGNGDWTEKLKKLLQANSDKGEALLQLEAAIEGPYGHRLNYLSRYDVFVFIAGGSGISPILSIMKDLLYGIQEKHFDPPKQITLIYTVKKSDELCILESISLSSLRPDFIQHLDIDVQAYVTREDAADPEAQEKLCYSKVSFDSSSGTRGFQMKSLPSSKAIYADASPATMACYFSRPVKAMSPPLTTNGMVQAITIVATFIGYLILAAIISTYYIYPVVSNPKRTFSRSGKGFLAFLETVLAVLIFGGASALVSKAAHKRSGDWTPQVVNELTGSTTPVLKPSKVHYGRRPDFAEVFAGQSKLTAGCNVGVVSCGPEKMQKDVAAFCQNYRTTMDNATYNYHPLHYSF